MYNDFKMKDAAGNEIDRPETDQFVVLFRDAHSRNWMPMYWAKDLNTLKDGTGNPVGQQGAIDYIRDHSISAVPGSDYRIKNRKGEIVS